MLSGLAKKVLSVIAAPILTAAMTVLPAVHVAFAASTDSSLPSGYAEMLRLAEEKVNAATQPGAFGKRVPIAKIDPAGMRPWIGLGIALSVGVVIAVKLLTPGIKSVALTAQ